MENKTCCKCKLPQSLDCFNKNISRKDGLHGSCKTCSSEYTISYTKKSVALRAKGGYAGITTKTCTGCGFEKDIDSFHKNINKKDGFSGRCRACSKEYQISHNLKPEIRLDRNAYHREYTKQYIPDRNSRDPLYKLTRNLRALISVSFRNGGWKKNSRTHEILGCTYVFALSWLIASFYQKYGHSPKGIEVDIDHIIPLASATCYEELASLNHITNLRYLKSSDNASKSDKYGQTEIDLLAKNKIFYETLIEADLNSNTNSDNY